MVWVDHRHHHWGTWSGWTTDIIGEHGLDGPQTSPLGNMVWVDHRHHWRTWSGWTTDIIIGKYGLRGPPTSLGNMIWVDHRHITGLGNMV